MFVSSEENTKQANKTRDNEYLRGHKVSEETRQKISEANKGEKSPMYGRTGEKNPTHGELVAQIDKDTNKILNLKYNGEYGRLGFNAGNITECCKKRRKTSQGYIFKYISDCTDEQLQEYYESLN